MKRIATLATAATLAFAGTAKAELPGFTAQCPQGLTVTNDLAGNIKINGSTPQVHMYNQNFFEATAGGITFSISTEADGTGLMVNYQPPGNAGGFCTITSIQTGPGQSGAMTNTMAGADGPDHFRVDVESRLLVHSRPSTSSPTVAKLPRGMVVENLGCQEAEGRTWCHIADGDASGWAAGEFLVEASGPIRSPQSTPVMQNNQAASHTVERVRFPSGTNGTEFTDELAPDQSRNYLLGARNGQDLYFRLAANGPGMTYAIYNPDGSVLLDEVSSDQEYRGQLWQSGEHTITVYNTANGAQSYNLIFGID